MATITSANTGQAIVKLIAGEALPALMGNLVMGNLVNRNFENDLRSDGDTVNIPITPTMSANNIAEGGSVSTQNPSLGNAQIVLNSHIEASFKIPDVTAALVKPDLIRLYMQPAVLALAEKIEGDLLALYPQFTFNSAVGTTSTDLTEDTVDSAEKALFDAKVPQSFQKYLIVSSGQYSVLRQLERFSEFMTAEKAGLQALITGQLGRMKDFVVLRSQYVTTSHNPAFTRNAIGLAIRPLDAPLQGTGVIAQNVSEGNFGMRVLASYDGTTLSSQFTIDVLYGAAVIDARHAIDVKSN